MTVPNDRRRKDAVLLAIKDICLARIDLRCRVSISTLPNTFNGHLSENGMAVRSSKLVSSINELVDVRVVANLSVFANEVAQTNRHNLSVSMLKLKLLRYDSSNPVKWRAERATQCNHQLRRTTVVDPLLGIEGTSRSDRCG